MSADFSFSPFKFRADLTPEQRRQELITSLKRQAEVHRMAGSKSIPADDVLQRNTWLSYVYGTNKAPETNLRKAFENMLSEHRIKADKYEAIASGVTAENVDAIILCLTISSEADGRRDGYFKFEYDDHRRTRRSNASQLRKHYIPAAKVFIELAQSGLFENRTGFTDALKKRLDDDDGITSVPSRRTLLRWYDEEKKAPGTMSAKI